VAEIGRIIGGRYRLVELLGEGWVASVYRATDIELSRDVAVKVLVPEYSGDAEFVSEFRRQTRSAAALSHPNVAAVFDFGQDPVGVYVVMEYVDGEDLASLIQRNGPVPARSAARVTAEVAEALAAARDHGLVHASMRPDNVMIARDGTVKVTDFGIARAAAGSKAPAADAATTAAYSSPELASGAPAGETADVYALGVLLFELLTGRRPWEGKTVAEIEKARGSGEPPRPSELRQGIPPALEMIDLKALAAEPDLRYESATAMAEDLEAFIEDPTAMPLAAASAASLAAASGGAPLAIHPNPTGRVTYSPDAYATGPGVPDEYETDAQGAAAFSPDSEPARRLGRRAQMPEALPVEPEEPASSPWIWVAAILGLFVVTITCLIVFLVASKESAPVVWAPYLVGDSYATAQQQADSYGLQIVASYRENDGDQPDGTVVDQNPSAGSQMHKGDTIYVTVVTGQPLVEVPNLVGVTEADATKALQDAGFKLGARTDQYDSSIPAGSIISTNPKAGVDVPKGTEIDYVVSKGPEPSESPSESPSPSPSPSPTPTPTPTPTATATTTETPTATTTETPTATTTVTPTATTTSS
jgi:serine/threonine-protein kinase